MSENRDSETKTDLVDLENKLNDAFNYAHKSREYYGNGSMGALQSIGEIAKAIIDVRRQRHIEEGRGEMYNTRHTISVPHGRTLNRKG